MSEPLETWTMAQLRHRRMAIDAEISRRTTSAVARVDGECSDAKRAETSLRPLYAAPPIPRVEQEPVAWVLFDDIFIAPKDMPDDPPNLECMKPLYAHPLALREPTEDECRRIANEFLILGGPDELAGRVMFNAVREVMTK